MYPYVMLTLGALALVMQNLVMVKITGQTASPLIAMAANSLVGISILFALILWRLGTDGIAQTAQTMVGWGLIPGLLGTLFVFSSILGYQTLGPTRTVTVLVAGQLIIGLVVDLLAHRAGIASFKTAIGVVFLITGAAMVLSRSAE